MSACVFSPSTISLFPLLAQGVLPERDWAGDDFEWSEAMADLLRGTFGLNSWRPNQKVHDLQQAAMREARNIPTGIHQRLSLAAGPRPLVADGSACPVSCLCCPGCDSQLLCDALYFV